jgi:hypothetical protein
MVQQASMELLWTATVKHQTTVRTVPQNHRTTATIVVDIHVLTAERVRVLHQGASSCAYVRLDSLVRIASMTSTVNHLTAVTDVQDIRVLTVERVRLLLQGASSYAYVLLNSLVLIASTTSTVNHRTAVPIVPRTTLTNNCVPDINVITAERVCMERASSTAVVDLDSLAIVASAFVQPERQ